jgi:MFS family permease
VNSSLYSADKRPFVCAISRKYGKRPMFLFSAVMGVIGAIVGAISPNYSTLVAARILQGLSSSAFESIIVTVIGYFLKGRSHSSDMYFVHQRGLRVALFSLVIGTIGNG